MSDIDLDAILGSADPDVDPSVVTLRELKERLKYRDRWPMGEFPTSLPRERQWTVHVMAVFNTDGQGKVALVWVGGIDVRHSMRLRGFDDPWEWELMAHTTEETEAPLRGGIALVPWHLIRLDKRVPDG